MKHSLVWFKHAAVWVGVLLVFSHGHAQPARLAFGQPVTLDGHIDAVLALDFSPDGALLASGSEDASVRVWSVADAAPRAEQYDHGAFVRAVAFLPGDDTPHLLLSAGWDRSLIFWGVDDMGALTLREQFAGYEGVIDLAAFTTDGATFAFSVGDGTVRLHTTVDGLERHRLVLDGGLQVTALAFDPTGSTLATAAGFPSRSVQRWSVETGRLLAALPLEATPTALVFASEERLIVGDDAGGVAVWAVRDPAPAEPLVVLPAGDWVTRMALDTERGWLAVARLDGSVEIWDVAEPETLTLLARQTAAHPGGTYALAFQPGADAALLATGGEDGRIRLWPLAAAPGG